MGCKCARRSDQYHGWECTVTDDECAFLVPNSNLCAEIYGEKPDADKEAVCIEMHETALEIDKVLGEMDK